MDRAINAFGREGEATERDREKGKKMKGERMRCDWVEETKQTCRVCYNGVTEH